MSSWNLWAWCISVGAILFTALWLHMRRRQLDLADLTVVASGLVFGPGLLLRVTAEPAFVRDWIGYWPDGVLLWTAAASSILISVLVVGLWVGCCPPLAQMTRMSTIRMQLEKAGLFPASLLAGAVAFIVLYGAIRHGMVGNVIVSEEHGSTAQEVIRTMPYWFSSLRQLFGPLVIAVSAIVAALLTGREQPARRRVAAAFLLLILVVCAGVFGRRMLMYVLLIVLIFNIDSVQSIIKPRILVISILALGLLVTWSNVQEHWRASVGEMEFGSAIKEWDAIEKTGANFMTRRPIWSATYMAIAESRDHGALGGLLLKQSVVNSVPAFLAVDKEYVNVDEVLANSYGIEVTDYPNTSTQVVIADWGLIGGLIAGVTTYVLAVMLPTGLGLQTFRSGPAIGAMVVGGGGYVLVNVEMDYYTMVFTLWKYLALVGCVGVAGQGMRHFGRLLRPDG